MASATPFGLRHASASPRAASGSRPSDGDRQGKKAAAAAGRITGKPAALPLKESGAAALSDEDSGELDPRREPAFRLRRLQNWFFLGLMYGFFYMSRYNFSAVQAAVAEQFGWSYSDYGSIISAGLLTYGCAVFFNGPLADRIGGKRAILIGAAGAAVFNVLFGLCHLLLIRPATIVGDQVVIPAELASGMSSSTVIAMFAVLWACNHYFQSCGALSIVKINAAWFRISERGQFAGIFGIMIQGGRTMAFTLLPITLKFFPWQYAFFIPAAFLVVMWFLCLSRVENTPAAAGHGELDTGDESPEEKNADVTIGFVLRKVFARRAPWIIALASMCIGMVRHSVDHWYARYIGVMFGVPAKNLATFAPYEFASVAMPIAAILGGLCAGNASDRLFGSRRAPVIFLAFVGQAMCLLMLRGYIHNSWGACLSLVFISFFVQSAHSLVGGAASMDFGGRKAVATAAGLFDGAQYLAGSIVGAGMGRLLDHYRQAGHPGAEFAAWPIMPLCFAIIGAAIISRLWHALPGRSAHSPSATSSRPRYSLRSTLAPEAEP
jgi:OPA family glycerol-3-phosphate transporter-like MFS transporter